MSAAVPTLAPAKPYQPRTHAVVMGSTRPGVSAVVNGAKSCRNSGHR